MLTSRLEPQHTSEQLLQILFSLQMEDQQAEMVQLYETAALENSVVACVQTRLLK